MLFIEVKSMGTNDLHIYGCYTYIIGFDNKFKDSQPSQYSQSHIYLHTYGVTIKFYTSTVLLKLTNWLPNEITAVHYNNKQLIELNNGVNFLIYFALPYGRVEIVSASTMTPAIVNETVSDGYASARQGFRVTEEPNSFYYNNADSLKNEIGRNFHSVKLRAQKLLVSDKTKCDCDWPDLCVWIFNIFFK